VQRTQAAGGRRWGAGSCALLAAIALAGCGAGGTSSASTPVATTPTAAAATTAPATTTGPRATAPVLPAHTGQRVSAAVYLTSVCTTLGSWKNTVQSAVNRFDKVLASAPANATPASVTPVLSSFIAQVGASTVGVVVGLHQAGYPNVKQGAALENALTIAFGRAVTVLTNAQGQVARLPTSAAAFGAAATRLGKTVESSLTSLASTFRSLESSELKSAAKTNRACEALKKG
jgi:hypothetical protein